MILNIYEFNKQIKNYTENCDSNSWFDLIFGFRNFRLVFKIALEVWHALILLTRNIRKIHFSVNSRPINMHPDIFLGSGTFKKPGPKSGVQKAGLKKQGHCYSKRQKAR